MRLHYLCPPPKSLSDSPVVDLARNEVLVGAFSLSRTFAAERPEVAHLFVEALEAGCRHLRENPKNAPNLIAKYTAAKNPSIAAKVAYPKQLLRSEVKESQLEYLFGILKDSGLDLPKVTVAELNFGGQ